MVIVNAILPIFLILLVGFLLAKKKILPIETSTYLTQYIFWIAGPAVIFLSISSQEFHQFEAWNFWLAYILEILVVGSISFVVFLFLFKKNARDSLFAGVGTTVKNTIIIGFPVLLSLTNKEAAIPMAITVITFNAIISPLLVFIFIISEKQGRRNYLLLFKTALETIKNPLVIAAFLGIIFSVFKITPLFFIYKTLNYFGESFIPCALLAVGMDLSKLSINSKWVFKIIIISTLSLLVSPIVAILISKALSLSDFYSVSLVIFSALPTAKILYVYAKKYNSLEAETAMSISITTICAMFTLPAFIMWSYFLWPAVFHGSI